jgi:hypothetical protein
LSAAGILLSTIAAALVVVSGALYALLFALGRLRASRLLSRCAWAAYASLVVCTFALSTALELDGGWLWIIVLMLVGYLLAPGAIWHLSVGTHAGEPRLETQGQAPRR